MGALAAAAVLALAGAFALPASGEGEHALQPHSTAAARIQRIRCMIVIPA
jgi:hypothetical protein